MLALGGSPAYGVNVQNVSLILEEHLVPMECGNMAAHAFHDLASHALKLFSISYLVRWFSIIAQSFLTAIEKPVHATVISVATALVFPVLLLGALWNMGLDGIWLNTFGTALLTGILSVIMIILVQKGIRKGTSEMQE